MRLYLFDDVHGGTIYRDQMGFGPAVWTCAKSIVLMFTMVGLEYEVPYPAQMPLCVCRNCVIRTDCHDVAACPTLFTLDLKEKPASDAAVFRHPTSRVTFVDHGIALPNRNRKRSSSGVHSNSGSAVENCHEAIE